MIQDYEQRLIWTRRMDPMTDPSTPPISETVSWPLDDTTVDATIVRLDGPGSFPAVVFVAGSGPTDRDWTSPLLAGTNGSARLLADALAQAGFASLRYDKRVVGPHAKENMRSLLGKLSMQSHVDELRSAISWLTDQRAIRADRIFIIASSEGTLHALNYQLGKPAIPCAGLVLIGPPGRPVGDVGRSQLAEQAAALPNGDALLALYDEAIARFLNGQPLAPDPLLPPGVQQLLQALESPMNLPFARELWTADGASLLGKVDVPTLVVIGKKDIQVDWRADGEPLQRAAMGNAQITFLFPEDANHVLKHEPLPRTEINAGVALNGYNSAEAQLDAPALAGILDWLRALRPGERQAEDGKDAGTT